jgi:hypothetical protein
VYKSVVQMSVTKIPIVFPSFLNKAHLIFLKNVLLIFNLFYYTQLKW